MVLRCRCLEAISRGLTAKARTFKMLRTKPEVLKEEEEEEEAGGGSSSSSSSTWQGWLVT
jgi:hypothetical protein